MTLAQSLFHLLCERTPGQHQDQHSPSLKGGLAEARRFVQRFDGHLDVADKTILEVGCGYGPLTFTLAELGARHILATDINAERIQAARQSLEVQYPAFRDVISFQVADIHDVDRVRVDTIVSKDSFEHIADPEGFVAQAPAHLRPNGQLIIGFSGLWKSPYGGHISYMTRAPWAHLIFPESVILKERARFRPDEQPASLADIVGGLNKMTLTRFQSIMRRSCLDPVYVRHNVSSRRGANVAVALSQIPLLAEWTTFNIYGIWAAGARCFPMPD